MEEVKMDLEGLLRGLVNVVVAETKKNPEFRKSLEDVFAEFVPGNMPPVKVELTAEQRELIERYRTDGAAKFQGDMESLKKPQLKELAKKAEIKLNSSGRKAEWVYTIVAFCEKHAGDEDSEPAVKEVKEEPAQVGKETVAEPASVAKEAEVAPAVKESQEVPAAEPEKPAVVETVIEEPAKPAVEEKTETPVEPAKPVEPVAPQPVEAAKPQTATPVDPAFFNPYKVFIDGGEELLMQQLAQMDVDQLRKVIKNNHLDNQRVTTKWKDAEKLRNHILSRTKTRANQGNVFRNYDK